MEQQMYHERFQDVKKVSFVRLHFQRKNFCLICLLFLPFVAFFHLYLNFSLCHTLFPCRCNLGKNYVFLVFFFLQNNMLCANLEKLQTAK